MTGDPVTIVTGGSSGLGKEITRTLLARGIPTCVVGRSQKKLVDTQADLRSIGARLLAVAGDIANSEDVRRIFETIRQERLTPTMLFNVAGGGVFGPVEKLSRSDVDDVFAGGLIGLILMCIEGVRNMPDGSVIVNVMSTAALVGRVNESIYCAAKWGARGFTEALRMEAKEKGIRVVSAFPAGMKTAFWTNARGMSPDTSNFMDPAEVAGTIVHAVLDKQTLQVTELVLNKL